MYRMLDVDHVHIDVRCNVGYPTYSCGRTVEKTRLLGRPQPKIHPPVAINQLGGGGGGNKIHKHFPYTDMLQGPRNILK